MLQSSEISNLKLGTVSQSNDDHLGMVNLDDFTSSETKGKKR